MFSRCECNRWSLAWSAVVPMCFVCSALTRSARCGCRALKSSQHPLCSLLIVDTPGFQNPRLAKRECGATFEDLCHNYTQERLHSLFYQRTFVQELERYKEVRRHNLLFFLSLPPTSFAMSSAPFFLSTALYQMDRNTSRCHARLSPVVMSRVHASSPLISDACRYLFQPDQSRVTDLRRALEASHPATLPAVRLPERRSYFSFALHLISLWLCWNAPLKRSAWTVSKVCAGKLPPVLNPMDTYAPSSTLWTPLGCHLQGGTKTCKVIGPTSLSLEVSNQCEGWS